MTRTRGVIVAAVGFTMIAAPAVLWRNRHHATATVENRSVLVAHWRDLDSAGLGLQLQHRLAAVQHPELSLHGWREAFAAPPSARDVRREAERWGAAWVLSGTVRRSGGRTEVIVELARAADGVTVWSGTFWRDAEQLDSLPREVIAAVADALRSPPS